MEDEDTATTDSPARKRRPVAGFGWGIVFGLGLAISAVNLKIISLEIGMVAAVVIVGIVLGIAWSTLGPAKKAKSGAAP